MAPQLTQLFQIGIIVRNADKAAEFFEKHLGMGAPDEVSFMCDEGPSADLMIDGKPFHGKVSKMVFFRRFGMELELIEPIGDSPYKAWLDEHGPGIHHIAVNTAEKYDDILADYKKATGKDPWIRGQAMKDFVPVIPGYAMDFSYLDLREECGLIVELYKNIAPGKPGHDYEPAK